LLRIHQIRFARRDAEKTRIELIDPIEKATPLRVGLSRPPGFGIIKAVRVPAVSRDFANGIDAIAEQLPKCCGRVRSSGKSTADADDGDGKTFEGPGCGSSGR
jgi:hypothetical protein